MPPAAFQYISPPKSGDIARLLSGRTGQVGSNIIIGGIVAALAASGAAHVKTRRRFVVGSIAPFITGDASPRGGGRRQPSQGRIVSRGHHWRWRDIVAHASLSQIIASAN